MGVLGWAACGVGCLPRVLTFVVFPSTDGEGSLIIKRTPGRRLDKRVSTGETLLRMFPTVLGGGGWWGYLDLDEFFRSGPSDTVYSTIWGSRFRQHSRYRARKPGDRMTCKFGPSGLACVFVSNGGLRRHS